MPKRVDVKLPYRFSPRPYQLPILRARENGCLRFVQVWHRRSGKEKTDINLVIQAMMERVGTYYYAFPKLNQGRKVLWNGMDKDGMRFLDHFPKELLAGEPNNTEMRVTLKNGSVFQVIGSDNFDNVMGSNPIGIVFSEYSLQNPRCWAFFSPILAENGGWAIFNFTPRGENHGFEIYELAQNDPHWFCQLLTVKDTGAIPDEVLVRERAECIRLYGDDSFFQQEWFCRFNVPIMGAYYAHQLNQAYTDGRVGKVPYLDAYLVDTWWDLGVNDTNSIWFTQNVGAQINVIDYFEDSGKGLPYYAKVLKDRDYNYGTHNGPHDIRVTEWGSGATRLQTADNLGLKFRVAPKLPLLDGIDMVRNVFQRCWFDAAKCKQGINALKTYRKEYDEDRKTYLKTPFHDWSSNGADAFRTLGVMMTPESKRKREDAYATKRPGYRFNPATV